MNEMTVWKFAEETPEDAGVLERYRTSPPDMYGFGHHEFYRDESIESGREVRFPFTPTLSRLGRR